MDYQRNWLEETGSDDSHGRALWALGFVLGRSNTPALHNMAGLVFQQSLLAILETTSPRAWAFALVGIHEYLGRFAGDRRVSQVQEELAGRLLSLYKDNKVDGWNWFEDKLTYCNAVLSHVMLLCGQSIPNPEMTQVGLESLRWLADLQHADLEGKHFVPIGSNGFFPRDGDRARFDQQPVEAQAIVPACLEAHRITRNNSCKWKPGVLLTGSSGATICTCHCMTRPLVVVVMVCIRIEQMKTRVQSLRWHFFQHYWTYDWKKISSFLMIIIPPLQLFLYQLLKPVPIVANLPNQVNPFFNPGVTLLVYGTTFCLFTRFAS
jgi:hypothetical protein